VSTSPALRSACNPACTESTCSADTKSLNSCDTGSSLTTNVDCAEDCAAQGGTFTGVCGVTYRGMTENIARCWCQ
jgi:hypothetical protein